MNHPPAWSEWSRAVFCALALLASSGTARERAVQPRRPPMQVPVEYYKLPNGLKVVLSKDITAPVVARRGLLQHRLPDRAEGPHRLRAPLRAHDVPGLEEPGQDGVHQAGPVERRRAQWLDPLRLHELLRGRSVAHARNRLWAEADRMRGLAITQDNLKNQQGVVKNEVQVNVLNQPYGGFPWLDLPQYANTNWYNAHNFYGDLKDLDAATLDGRQEVLHDLLRSEQRGPGRRRRLRLRTDEGLDREVLHRIPATPRAAGARHLRAPAGEGETRVEAGPARDAARPRNRLPDAAAEHPRVLRDGTPRPDPPPGQGQPALRGDRPEERDVRRRERGDQPPRQHARHRRADAAGRLLFHDTDKTPDAILKVFDAEIENLRTKPVDAATLDLAIVKIRSQLYDDLESLFGFGRADLLASFALFDDDPGRINHLEEEFKKTPTPLSCKMGRRQQPAPRKSHAPPSLKAPAADGKSGS